MVQYWTKIYILKFWTFLMDNFKSSSHYKYCFKAKTIIYCSSITMIYHKMKFAAPCMATWWWHIEPNFIFWKFQLFSLIISIVQVIRAFISITFIAWNIIYFNSITKINSRIKSDALCTPLWWKNYETNFIFQKSEPLSLIISIVLIIFCIAIMIFRPILSLWRVFILKSR